MFCPECGARVQPEDPFCGECGVEQDPLPPTPPPVVVQARSGRVEQDMPESKNPKKAPTSQLEPGTLLQDRYIIMKRVGGGGMGSVYQARDKRLADRLCAVKEMIELFADANQRAKAVDDFRREAAVLAQLKHPSIPTVYDNFIDGGRYYLVMEWIGGGDLADQMRQRGGTVDEAVVSRWAVQICDVLDYIHSQVPPIIYRDLKPANLMLDDKNRRVMLVDFGIARIVRPTEKGVTAIGTMGYAPPELFAGKVEPRSDIYSLGATMFHMLTGSDPQDNPLLIFDFSKNPRPRQINSSISLEMENLLIRSVAHKPEDRHKSALEFKRLLEEHALRLEARKKGESQRPAPVPSPIPTSTRIGGSPLQEAKPAPPSSIPGREPRIPSNEVMPPMTASPVQPQPPLSVPPPPTADNWVFCGNCGEKIGVDDVFCAHCGSKQPIGGVSIGRTTAQLVVVGTSDMVQPKPFPIGNDVLIGRTDPHTGIFPQVDLTMYDPETKVSRKHARIYRQGEDYLVEDLGSVNGTFLNSPNGKSVRLNKSTPQKLSAGDVLKLGGTTLQFKIV